MDLTGAFDPSSMQYLTTQMVHPGAHDTYQDMLMPNDYQDHHSAYGYAGSDDVNLHGLQHTMSLKRFSTNYEDPFSDVVSAFETQTQAAEPDTESPTIDRDNKLLGFSAPSYEYTLLDYNYQRVNLSLSAQLHGMFFLAESPWSAAGEAQNAPSELTCYRRNLFQISGEITLPRALRYIMTEQGEQIPIIGQELVVSATESTENNAVKIICVPWKTPTNPTGSQMPDDKMEREPHSIPLDLIGAQETATDTATFPISWKRLQFRIATANNGRRKELQQHFVVRLKILATLSTGGKVPICSAISAPIIVRGRSPRNFQSRKDLPLNGGGRRAGGNQRPGSGDSAAGTRARPDGPTSAPIKVEPVQNQNGDDLKGFYDSVGAADYSMQQDMGLAAGGSYDWSAINATNNASAGMRQTGAMTAIPQSFTSPPLPGGTRNFQAMSSPDLTRQLPQQHQQNVNPSIPINLSLVEDDSPLPTGTSGVLGTTSTNPLSRANTKSATPESPSHNKLRPLHPPPKKISIPPPRPPSFSINNPINSPDESADLLYEYFPLGLDDWMPPVDAVYRPHVVHHTKLPSDPRDPRSSGGGGVGGRNSAKRSRRYFSEDVS